jgi:hypothetical protein
MLRDVMEHTVTLADARAALRRAADSTAVLVRSQPDLRPPIPSSEWTVREVAVHLMTGALLSADIATGMPSPVASLSVEAIAKENAQRIADIPEGDPATLAQLSGDAVGRLLEATDGRNGDEEVAWHGGLRISVVQLVCVSLGEQVLHGHDIAIAVGSRWPIRPTDARLVLHSYATIETGAFRLHPRLVNHSAGNDTTDPVTMLLAGTGRIRPLA